MLPDTNAHDVCYRCGYDLTGIGDETPCPECGLLARRSRRPTDELHYTRPRWLCRISRGTNLLLLAVLLFGASPALAVVLTKLSYAMFPARGYEWLLPHVPLLAVHAAALCALAGAWFLASKEGYPPADRADRIRRILLRIVAISPIVGATAKSMERHLIFNGGYWGIYDYTWNPLAIAMAASMAGTIALPIIVFATLRDLAKRARSAHLAEHCTIVGMGTSAVLAYGVLRVSLFYGGVFDIKWLQRSTPGMALMLVMFVGGLLFAIWSVYLLVRFTIAFRRTSRQLRAAWREDDRAIDAATTVSAT
jgi:hypothetical protein